MIATAHPSSLVKRILVPRTVGTSKAKSGAALSIIFKLRRSPIVHVLSEGPYIRKTYDVFLERSQWLILEA